MRRWLVPLVTIMSVEASAVALHGQQQQPANQKATAFEVVSIVPRRMFERGGSLKFQPGGRLEGTNVYVLALIATAFGNGHPLLPEQIEGGPDWIRSDRFDVVAKTDTTVADEATLYRQLPTLLQPVLQERFRLKAHWETRQLPVYALVLAHNNGSLGPQLRRSNCRPRPETIGSDETTAVSRDDRPICKSATVTTGLIDAAGISILSLVSALSSGVARVVDAGGIRTT